MIEKINIDLNGKMIYSKPLKLNETLDSIREIIKGKIVIPFFLEKDENIKLIEKMTKNLIYKIFFLILI